ncbi:hypothetical protein K4L06_04955 [Lysobacter sp. BMK333-48F3]|uniref:hypothetical protein n=1 Tax=Lysobacter sp. BMK333-48F3 TaxID=2867962 RepID=UPI001C8B13FE|nr:hypothetical protein [Lysobacter sp. BMK333-48F3]MBX9400651.1 hypothetical protein [Lysobacter sp. BMK333-48F3]
MRWMASTVLALAGATLAHAGAAAIAAEAGEAALRAPEAGTALWIGADHQHAGEYPFSLALGDAGDDSAAAPWLGRELRVYADGQARGRARPLRRIAGSDLGCSEPDRLAFAPGDEAPALGEHGAWLADFDLNPEQRLQRRAATAAEREELLAELVAMAVPGRVERPQRLRQAVAQWRRDGEAAGRRELWLVADARAPQRRWALLTLDAEFDAGADDARERIGAVALFAREADDRGWRRRAWVSTASCADCEGMEPRHQALDFADLDRDGAPDFLFEVQQYESWSHRLLRSGGEGGSWQALDGGGGC